MNFVIKRQNQLYLSLLILNSMKFLRMPNKAQSLRTESLRIPHENQQNIDPQSAHKPLLKVQSFCTSMEVEQAKKYVTEQQIYENQILEFIIRSVRKSPEHYNYFARQPDITEHMRMVLLNWLVDVHLKYKLNPQTLFITIHIIDTYLSAQTVYRNQLQLVGVTALWIAAKYQETYQVPKLSNLVYICDSTYTQAQILQMESKILMEMKFDFLKITSLYYFDALKRKTLFKEKDQFLGRYILQTMIFDISSRKYNELTIAASLRGYQLIKQQKISEISRVPEKQLRTCAREICSMWKKINEINQMSGLRLKYAKPEFMEVSKIRISQKPEKSIQKVLNC